MSNILQFAPFSSCLDIGFWYKLTENKLDIYGLDDKPKKVYGFYYNGDFVGMPCCLNVDYTAFNEVPKIPVRHFLSHGELYNTNTIEAFKSRDKKALLEKTGDQLWDDITSGRVLEDPSLLSRFLILTYADLKKYNYYYWFAFPALCFYENVRVMSVQKIDHRYSKEQLCCLMQAHDAYNLITDSGYFIVEESIDGFFIKSLKEFNSLMKAGSKILLAFCDPCKLEEHPGWPLRNLLATVVYYWLSQITPCDLDVLCFRDRTKGGVRDCSHSIILSIHFEDSIVLKSCPNVVGWEKNMSQKMAPRVVNLSSSMDPNKLAESSVDLNLKLMRWRLVPSLDLKGISSTKCLLLGAGTLGCNVARCLLAWGVRNITLIDNSTISYSNPVRQSLFIFDDCLHGGKHKAIAAAESLKKIFPGVNAKGINLSIPMPGHFLPRLANVVEQTQNDVQTLENLIDSHDVIFLLMDTRESRWLPTLLGAYKKKLVINAALGFDTFMVMRHGVKLPSDMGVKEICTNGFILGCHLGCYFCNDVVAPGNSTKDRTLDQQCTVTRPGISMIASALAVELLITVLQHPEGKNAPAITNAYEGQIQSEMQSPLGIVPHQIRGFLSQFHQVMPANMSFDKCTACSDTVIEKYGEEGFDFLLNVFNETNYLEDLTGLTQLHAETENAEIWELSDDDSDYNLN